MRAAGFILLAGIGISVCAICRGAELQDPTRPYLYDISPPVPVQGQGKEEWHLTGVQIRGSAKSAILNGKLVQVGDRIGAASVIKIVPWQVTLTEDYRQIVVNLLGADVKQKVGAAQEHE